MARIKIENLPALGELSQEETERLFGGRSRRLKWLFQNFDQKNNQMYNLLSSVMKSMNEMRQGSVRNML